MIPTATARVMTAARAPGDACHCSPVGLVGTQDGLDDSLSALVECPIQLRCVVEPAVMTDHGAGTGAPGKHGVTE